MDEKYYLDVNIWLDFYEKRDYDGLIAKKFFEKVILEKDVIFYSDLIVQELKRLTYSSSEINELFSVIKSYLFRKVHISKQQILEARKIAKKHDIPKADALHAILARDNELILVSRDTKDFGKIRYVIKFNLPKDLIKTFN